jgi:hypothetical protein
MIMAHVSDRWPLDAADETNNMSATHVLKLVFGHVDKNGETA